VGRERPEVRAAARSVSADPSWLHPALVALADDGVELDDGVRQRWLDTISSS
jgi:hypothetical protein